MKQKTEKSSNSFLDRAIKLFSFSPEVENDDEKHNKPYLSANLNKGNSKPQTSPFSRPFERRYELSKEWEREEMAFINLRNAIFKELDSKRKLRAYGNLDNPAMFRESGKLGDNRRYFYLKAPGESGWLFERAGNGWVISRSEKIIGQNTFLRGSEVWDIVNLYAAKDGEEAPLRVSSHRTNGEIISMTVYRQKLFNSLCI